MNRYQDPLKHLHSKKHDQGFTLIEVMVAMLVLAVGMVAIAMLQVRSLQASHASYQQSLVVVMANDLVERLWASLCDHNEIHGDIVDEWEGSYANIALLPDWEHDVDYDEVTEIYTIDIEWNDRIGERNFVYSARIPIMDCD